MSKDYNKTQLRNIYNDAINNKVNTNDQQLSRIKDSLSVICRNTNYATSSLRQLICFLNQLPDHKLSLIDDNLVHLLQIMSKTTESKLMSTITAIISMVLDDKITLGFSKYAFNLSYFKFINEDNLKLLELYNYDLAKTLEASMTFMQSETEKFYCTVESNDIYDIFQSAFKSFISNIEYYGNDYSLPSKIASYVDLNYDSLKDIMIICYEPYKLSVYKEALAKILLSRLSGNSKVVSIEEAQLQKELKKQNYNLSYIFRKCKDI